MPRLDTDRQQELEPERIKYAIEQLERLGISIESSDTTSVKFRYKNQLVTFFPYSGWHSGKSIKDGRGLSKLLKQLK